MKKERRAYRRRGGQDERILSRVWEEERGREIWEDERKRRVREE